MADEIIVLNVDRFWKSMVRKTKSKVHVFSPYLSSTARTILRSVPPERCEIHTVCSIENFLSKASNIHTVRSLLTDGFKLFHVDNLHAKVVIASGEWATIGSQNMTKKGTSNHEATVVVTTQDDIHLLEQSVMSWIALRRPIEKDEIEDIAVHVNQLTRQHKSFLNDLAAAEEATRTSRKEREYQEAQRQLLIQKPLSHLERYRLDGVSKLTAVFCLMECAWWEEKYRGPGRWKKSGDHIEGDNDRNWTLKIGHGHFLVAQAFMRCADVGRRFVQDLSAKKITSRSELYDSLRIELASSATGRYGAQSDRLVFGSYSVRFNNFISFFMKSTHLDETMAEIGM